MICPNCGFNEEGGSEFCGNCGYAFGAALPPPSGEQAAQAAGPPPAGGGWDASQPPVPPAAGGTPMPPAGTGTYPAQAPPGKGGRKLAPILIAVCALLLIAVVVLVLVFTVFKGGGEEKKGEKASGEPAEVAEAYLKALEERDLGAILDLIDPGTLEDLEDEYGEEYRDIMEGFFFGELPEGLEFSGLKFSQQVKGGRAEVFIEEGTATYRDEERKKQTVDLAEVMEDALELVRKDGAWYITMEGFGNWEDYLADYEGNGDKDKDKDEDEDGGLPYFESMLVGVSFSYPKGWTPKEYSEGMVEIGPDGMVDRAKVSVYTEDLTGVSYSLEDWMADRSNELDSQGWPYESDYTILLGEQAGQFVFSYLGEASAGYKVMDVFTVLEDTAYIVSYIALEEDFDTYLEGAETIIYSLDLLAVHR